MFKYKKSAIFLIPGCFVFAILIGGRFPYFVFYTVFLTVLLSYLWTLYVVKKLRFSVDTEKMSVYTGDRVELKVDVQNKSLLIAPYIELNNEMIKTMTGKAPLNNIISIMPLSSKRVVESVNCKYRGHYIFGPINALVSDVFGIFSWNKKIICPGVLTVYPKVSVLQHFYVKPAQAFGTLTTKKKAHEDYSSISDIRTYYPGDSLKRIHWKVSARKGSLQVKEFDMSGNIEAFIFLNMYNRDYCDIYRLEMEERAVESAAAAIYYMLRRNINTSSYANCSKMTHTKGRDLKEFKKFLDELVTIKSDGTTTMADIIGLRLRLLPGGSSVVLITPMLDKSLLDKIIQLKSMGFEVIIIYIMIEDMDEECMKIFDYYGIKLYKIGLSDDVRTSLEG